MIISVAPQISHTNLLLSNLEGEKNKLGNLVSMMSGETTRMQEKLQEVLPEVSRLEERLQEVKQLKQNHFDSKSEISAKTYCK